MPKSPDKYYGEWSIWKNFFITEIIDIEKCCSQCSLFKNIEEFGKDNREIDKHKTYCKDCGKKYYEKYKNKNTQ